MDLLPECYEHYYDNTTIWIDWDRYYEAMAEKEDLEWGNII